MVTCDRSALNKAFGDEILEHDILFINYDQQTFSFDESNISMYVIISMINIAQHQVYLTLILYCGSVVPLSSLTYALYNWLFHVL